jgi:hypothetical protein
MCTRVGLNVGLNVHKGGAECAQGWGCMCTWVGLNVHKGGAECAQGWG